MLYIAINIIIKNITLAVRMEVFQLLMIKEYLKLEFKI